jgi:hypothetical protein
MQWADRTKMDAVNIVAEVARTGEVTVIEGWDERFDRNVTIPETHENQLAYFVPIKHGDQVLGLIATGSHVNQREQTLQALATMGPLLDHVAIAMVHIQRVRGHPVQLVIERMQREILAMEQTGGFEELVKSLAAELLDLGVPMEGMSFNVVDEQRETGCCLRRPRRPRNANRLSPDDDGDRGITAALARGLHLGASARR